jgi:hypothetical protein
LSRKRTSSELRDERHESSAACCFRAFRVFSGQQQPPILQLPRLSDYARLSDSNHKCELFVATRSIHRGTAASRVPETLMGLRGRRQSR